MLNLQIRKALHESSAGDAKTITEYYDRHTACVDNFFNYGNEDHPETDYKFDVTSWASWNIALVELNCCSKTSIPLWLKSAGDKKELEIAAKKLKQILDKFHGFVRTDTCIPVENVKQLLSGKRFPGFSRNYKTLAYDRIKVTKQMLTAQYFSSISDLGLMIQDGHKDLKMFAVTVQDGKILGVHNNDITKFVTAVTGHLKTKNILPWHPQYSEVEAPDYTFKLIISADEYGLSLFNASIYVPPELVQNKIDEMS